MADKKDEAYPYHPIADCLDLLQGADLESLATDIAENGLLDDIALYEGKVLDGRNRLRACLLKGVKPRFREFRGDPFSFVKSKNIHRRHSDETRRAVAAANLSALRGTYPNAPTQQEAADMMRVSRRTVQMAQKAIDEAPEVVEALRNGQIKAATAAETAGLPKPQRKRVARAAAHGGAHAATSELRAQQESLIARRGCQALKDAFEAGKIALANAAAIARTPVPHQMVAVRELLEEATPARKSRGKETMLNEFVLVWFESPGRWTAIMPDGVSFTAGGGELHGAQRMVMRKYQASESDFEVVAEHGADYYRFQRINRT